MEQKRNAYRVLVVKREGRRPLGRPGRRWEHNIEIILKEGGCGLDLSAEIGIRGRLFLTQ
jgi:hypothetical protein